jgi:hypothetical protein
MRAKRKGGEKVRSGGDAVDIDGCGTCSIAYKAESVPKA